MNSEEQKKRLVEGGKALRLDITGEMADQFFIYKDKLLEWNEKINLTAITDDEGILVKHFLDSLTVAGKIKQGAKVIDVGTGAGFPGLPLKIVRPDIGLTLLDSLNKRLIFLKDAIFSMGIDGVEMVHMRAEEGGQNKQYREKFDVALSRAVAKYGVLAEYCLPFVKVGGCFIALKGPECKGEVEDGRRAAHLLGGEKAFMEEVEIPFSDLRHCLIITKKNRQTPPKYPRNGGQIAKNPIK